MSNESAGYMNMASLMQDINSIKYEYNCSVLWQVKCGASFNDKQFVQHAVKIISQIWQVEGTQIALAIQNHNIQKIEKECFKLFQDNVATQNDQKYSVRYLVAEYCHDQVSDINKKMLRDTELRPIAQKIFYEYMMLVDIMRNELSKSSDDPQKQSIAAKLAEYLGHYNISDTDTILFKARKAFDTKQYDMPIRLHADAEDLYTLPAAYSLILLEDEQAFKERLAQHDFIEALQSMRDTSGSRSVLHFALARHKYEIAREIAKLIPELLDIPNQIGRTPLHLVCKGGDKQTIEMFLKHTHAQQHILAKDGYGRTPLHLAAMEGSMSAIEILVRIMPDMVNARDGYGRTPLHLAAMSNKIEVVEFLCVNNANKEAIDGDPTGQIYERTPMHLAAMYDSTEAVQILVKHGASIDIPDAGRNNVVHVAAKMNSPNTLKFLLNHSAKIGLDVINSQNKHNSTPMHHTAFYGCIEAVYILLQYGAHTYIADKDGRTPLQVSMKNNEDLKNTFGEDNAFAKKAGAIVHLINADQSIFVKRHTLTQKWTFTDSAITTFKMDKYRDQDVEQFILKIYKFLKQSGAKILDIYNGSAPPASLIEKIYLTSDLTLCKALVEICPQFSSQMLLCARDAYLEGDRLCSTNYTSSMQQIRKAVSLVSSILDICNHQKFSLPDALFLIGLACLSKGNINEVEKYFIEALSKYYMEESLLLTTGSRALETMLTTFITSGNVAQIRKVIELFPDLDFTVSKYKLSPAIDMAIRDEKAEVLECLVSAIREESEIAKVIGRVLVFYLSKNNIAAANQLYEQWHHHASVINSVKNIENITVVHLVEDFLESSDYSDDSREGIKNQLNQWEYPIIGTIADILHDANIEGVI